MNGDLRIVQKSANHKILGEPTTTNTDQKRESQFDERYPHTTQEKILDQSVYKCQ